MITNVILAALITHRLARLITKDHLPYKIGDRHRYWWGRQAALNMHRPVLGGVIYNIAVMLICPFCIGLWIALAVAIAFGGTTKEIVVLWLASSGLHVLIAEVTIFLNDTYNLLEKVTSSDSDEDNSK